MKVLDQRTFLEIEIKKRKAKVERIENEIVAMEAIKKALETIEPPCERCNGKGELLDFDGSDSHFVKCDECNGTGRA